MIGRNECKKMCDGTTTINMFSQQGDVTPFIENLPHPVLDMDAANNRIYYLSGPGAFDGSLVHIPTGSNTPQLVAKSQNYASVLALPNEVHLYGAIMIHLVLVVRYLKFLLMEKQFNYLT